MQCGTTRRGEERRTRRRHEVRFGTATTEQVRAGKDTMVRCDHEADASAVCGVRCVSGEMTNRPTWAYCMCDFIRYGRTLLPALVLHGLDEMTMHHQSLAVTRQHSGCGCGCWWRLLAALRCVEREKGSSDNSLASM